MERKFKNLIIRIPIFIALALALGIFIGATTFSSADNKPTLEDSYRKFGNILGLINHE